MPLWGWVYIASGTKGTSFPLKLIMICGVVLRPCGNNLVPNHLSCNDCSTHLIILACASYYIGRCKIRGLVGLIATRVLFLGSFRNTTRRPYIHIYIYGGVWIVWVHIVMAFSIIFFLKFSFILFFPSYTRNSLFPIILLYVQSE